MVTFKPNGSNYDLMSSASLIGAAEQVAVGGSQIIGNRRATSNFTWQPKGNRQENSEDFINVPFGLSICRRTEEIDENKSR